MPGPLRVRARLAVARDRAVDDPRVRLAQGVVPATELVQDARAEALQHDVVVACEPEKSVATGLGLEVQADRALTAVEREVERRAGAQRLMLLRAVVRRRPADVVAHAGVLHLHDVGAEVREEQRAEAARQQARQVENANVGERPVGGVAHSGEASAVSIGCCMTSRLVRSSRLGTPNSSLASATVAARRPMSSAIWRTLAIRSPLDRAISPFGR